MLSAFAWRTALVSLVALAPALGVGVARVSFAGSGGAAPVLSLLASLMGVVSAAPLGLMLGAVVPRWAWPLSVLVLGLSIWYAPLLLNETVLINTGLSSRLMSLSWGLDIPVPGFIEPVSISLLRIAWFLVLVGLAWVWYWPAGSPARLRQKLTAALGAVGIWVVVAVGVTLMSPNLPLVTPTGEPVTCEIAEGGTTEVCLVQSHENLRSTLTDIIVPMSHMAGSRMPGTVAEDLQMVSNPSYVSIPVDLASTEDEYRQIVATGLSEALTNSGACERWDNGTESPTPDYVSHSRVLRAIQDRLVLGSGVTPHPWGVSDDGDNIPTYSDEFLRFRQLSDEAFGSWYQDNYERIVACDISLVELP